MPFKRELYPANWNAISKHIREQRAQNKCECRGECGQEHNGRCNAPNNEYVWRPSIGGQWFDDSEFEPDQPNGKTHFVHSLAITEMFRRVKVILTVAHLNHNPKDCRKSNLRAMCQACHLRYDAKHHAKNAAQTRRNKKVKAGQLELGRGELLTSVNSALK